MACARRDEQYEKHCKSETVRERNHGRLQEQSLAARLKQEGRPPGVLEHRQLAAAQTRLG